MAEKSRIYDNKKFMWDGEEYDDENKAKEVEKEYAAKGFEVQTFNEDGKILIYTRRVVTEVVLD